MSKKQLTTYKFDPGPIPPAFNQFPRTVSLVTANKNYIVAEATEFLSWKFNTPETAPANASTVENEVSLLLDNKDFIAQEANAWTLAQIASIVSPFVGYDYTEVKQNKIKRDIKSLVDAFAEDLAGGGNTETIRISRSALYLNGEDQLLSPDQDAAVYGFVKTLIADFVLARVAYSTDQDPVLAVQDLGSEIPVSDPADLAVSVANLNQLNDIVIVLITDGLDSLPALSYNYDAVFADLVYNENYAYDEQKCIRDTKYIIDALIYDLTVGGNSLTFYIASQYQVLGEYTVRNPIAVERTIQTFTKQLISQFVLINLYHPSYQLQISQTLLANAAEAAGNTQSQNLIDIVLNVLESGISSLPAVIVPNRQSGTLMPNAVSLLDRNKRYIMEETVAFVEFNVANNIFPFVFFNYNFSVGRQNISLVIEGYIKDFKNGGNVQTVFNAGQYWENGVSQIDGDRLPEVFTQRFIRDIIENFIWTNVPFGSRQIAVLQIFDNANLPEIFANTRLRELSNTITQVIESGLDFLPARVSNRGSIKIPGYFILQNILLITNTSRNQIIYNFADDTIGAEVVYSELFDPDFAGALFGVDKISTIILDSDTTGMSISDDIQIFVESENQTVRLNPIATDAMERMKVGIPQSMLDADFEYGLQPTKWQAIAQMRNYPSIFEIPGSEIDVTSITTDASDGTGGTGASLITVNTVSAHGLDINTPITLKALSNSVRGFSRAEGSFLVADIIGPNQFTFYAKAKVGTTFGEVLASTTTQLRRGGFYTGSSIGNPSISVFSSGAEGFVTTILITESGSNSIGFVGDSPPIGAPLSWTGAGDVIAGGTQITSVVGSGGTVASTTLAVRGNIGATTITVTNNAGISTGLLVNRGDNVGVTVTNVVGNNVSLSGSLTAIILGNTASYSGLAGVNNAPTTGTGAVFTVSRNGEIYSATATSPGTGYAVGNTITVLGSSLDGISPDNDAVITVTAATNIDLVSALDNASLIGGTGYSTDNNLFTTGGTGTGLTVNVTAADGIVTAVTVNNSGANYSVGDLITIDHPIGIGAVLEFSALFPTGTEYVSANNVPTSGGTGTGLTVNVTASNGEITALAVNFPGVGYLNNDQITIVGGADRGLVTAVTLLTSGENYDPLNTQDLATTGGSGTGLTVNINLSPDGVVNGLAISNGGTNYTSQTGVIAAVIGEVDPAEIIIDIVAVAGVVTEVVIVDGGNGFIVGDQLAILQTGSDNNAVVNVTSITSRGVEQVFVIDQGSGYLDNDVITIPGGTLSATFEVNSATIHDGQFTVTEVGVASTINVLTIAPGGAIQTVSAAGTPITAPGIDFVSAFTISESTLGSIPSGNQQLQYRSIATIQSVFATPHGLVPGDTITVAITSNGENAQFAAGPYFVESVPTPTSLRYTARAAGTIENTLVGQIFGRPDSFFIHRPLDGGVQLGTAGPSHGASAVRMSKKYIRYQSGKGVMYNTGALFAPSYDIRSLTSTGTAIGSVITITTDDTDHGCQVGGGITIKGAITVGYNGEYTVASVINERVLTVVAGRTLGSTDAEIGNPCELSIRRWHGSTIRAGIYDDQNGMFWQYDGIRMALVKRSATFQLAGTIAIEQNSNLIVGDNTRFRSQLGAGDKIVIRGMTHTVTSVISNTACTVAPDWRGVVDVAGVKASKVQDLQFPQEQWNIDTLDGKGPSGYNLDVTYMQMIGIQHTWYGAGFVDFMLRGSDGNYAFAHRLRNSNVNTEAYMRTGNQPVRYEVTNEGAFDKLSEDITIDQDFIPLEDAYWFPDSGTVYVDNELISFTGKTNTALTGCTRSAAMTQFTAGSQRSFTAGPASSHTEKTGVVLVSNTITPNISHWGSAFLIDGQFDDDRGYIFNYAATGISATLDKTTAFLIRLSPSVSNAVIGDLGEKELLNRAQLLLNEISITSDAGTGAIVIEGVLNPINYPEDPTAITWQGLNTQAQGGQPSFAQVASGGSVTWGAAVATSTATVQGAFSTTVTATSFDADTLEISASSFSGVTAAIVARTLNVSNFGGRDLRRAFISGRDDFYVITADLDALTTTLSLQGQVPVGDLLSNEFIGANRRINVIDRNVFSSGGVAYSRIRMTQNSQNTSGFNTAVSTGIDFQLPITYASALSTARSDFLITQSQFDTVSLATSDLVSAIGVLTGGQSISNLTASFANISGVSYARVQISATANGTSSPGTGNNVTVTVSAAATILYGRAISTGRQDFLVPQSQLTGSGILVGDRVNAATVLVDNQAVQQIISNFITINSIVYGRIVMSANGSANSASGAGNNVAVTVTASGSANSYSGNFVFFTGASFIASGATVGTRISTDYTQFPAGTAIASVSTRTFDGISVFRVTFSQSTSTPIAAVSTIEFQFGAEYALPGETVFSFIANPGETATLRLEDLKELTSSAIGGRGTFPNGPDVLAINIYKIAGVPVSSSVILRWGEAQA